MTGNACFIFKRDRLPFELGRRNCRRRYCTQASRVLLNVSCIMTERSKHWERKFRADSCLPDHYILSIGGSRQWPQKSILHRVAWSTNLPKQAQPVSTRIAINCSAGGQSTRCRGRPKVRLHVLGNPFSLRELAEFCNTRRLPIQDLRDQNGNLWIMTGDDRWICQRPASFMGLRLQSGKGWWRK